MFAPKQQQTAPTPAELHAQKIRHGLQELAVNADQKQHQLDHAPQPDGTREEREQHQGMTEKLKQELEHVKETASNQLHKVEHKAEELEHKAEEKLHHAFPNAGDPSGHAPTLVSNSQYINGDRYDTRCMQEDKLDPSIHPFNDDDEKRPITKAIEHVLHPNQHKEGENREWERDARHPAGFTKPAEFSHSAVDPHKAPGTRAPFSASHVEQQGEVKQAGSRAPFSYSGQ